MKLGNVFSKENLTAVGSGVAGAAVSVPAKKYLFAKIPGLDTRENLQDAAVLVTGIAIAAFSGKKAVKTFGLGMSIVGGYNLSLVSYALAPAGRNGAADKLVAGYLTDFIKSCAPAEAAKIGYVAIDGQLKSTALNLIELIG